MTGRSPRASVSVLIAITVVTVIATGLALVTLPLFAEQPRRDQRGRPAHRAAELRRGLLVHGIPAGAQLGRDRAAADGAAERRQPLHQRGELRVQPGRPPAASRPADLRGGQRAVVHGRHRRRGRERPARVGIGPGGLAVATARPRDHILRRQGPAPRAVGPDQPADRQDHPGLRGRRARGRQLRDRGPRRHRGPVGGAAVDRGDDPRRSPPTSPSTDATTCAASIAATPGWPSASPSRCTRSPASWRRCC